MDLQQWGFLRSQLVKRDSGDLFCYLLTPSRSPPRLCPSLLCLSPLHFPLGFFFFQSLSSQFFPSSVLSSSFSSAEMIQRSIHSLSDCSFSSLCPAVLPHCHSASNERSGSHGWYSRRYCAFIGDGYFCCFVICPESKNRAPRVLACNGVSLPWPRQIAYFSPAGQLRGRCRGSHGAHRLNEEELNAPIWHARYYYSDTRENWNTLLYSPCHATYESLCRYLPR